MEEQIVDYAKLRKVRGRLRHWDGTLYGVTLLADPADAEEDRKAELMRLAEADGSELVSVQEVAQ